MRNDQRRPIRRVVPSAMFFSVFSLALLMGLPTHCFAGSIRSLLQYNNTADKYEPMAMFGVIVPSMACVQRETGKYKSYTLTEWCVESAVPPLQTFTYIFAQ